MAHFAKVVNGTVTQVIVAEQEFMDTFVDDSPANGYKLHIIHMKVFIQKVVLL